MTDDLIARILDAWRVEKTTARHQGEHFSIHAMAAIAADVAQSGRRWSAGETIPGDVQTVWIGPELKATRTDDPHWWAINADVQESDLLGQLGVVYENPPTTADSAVARLCANTSNGSSEVVAVDRGDLDAARTALGQATATLEHLADRRGHHVTVDLAARCVSNARACDRAWELLTTQTRPNGDHK